MVDLKANPFYLSDEAIRWVEETIAGMTLDEKVGQLFVQMNKCGSNEDAIRQWVERYHQGGLR